MALLMAVRWHRLEVGTDRRAVCGRLSKAAVPWILDAELSGIIMEINNLRRVACAPDRPEQGRRRD